MDSRFSLKRKTMRTTSPEALIILFWLMKTTIPDLQRYNSLTFKVLCLKCILNVIHR